MDGTLYPIIQYYKEVYMDFEITNHNTNHKQKNLDEYYIVLKNLSYLLIFLMKLHIVMWMNVCFITYNFELITMDNIFSISRRKYSSIFMK